MKNKKIVLALSLVLALGATLMVGGSLAWFSDTDEATNTFTVGSVEIEQVEEFVQNSQLLPVGSNDTPADDENFIKKAVSVRNTGKNPAYVQTFVAVPAALDNGLLKQHPGSTADWTMVKKTENVSITFDHDDSDTTTDITQSFNVYCYRYNTALAVGAATTQVLSGIYVDEQTDIEVYRDDAGNITKAYFVWNGAEVTGFDLADGDSMKLHVLVATQAVQSQGFSSADQALAAAFPNHPWTASA